MINSEESSNIKYCSAIILSGGTGSRSGLDTPKQFLKISGKTILEHSLDVFEKHNQIDDIIVVCHPDFLTLCAQILDNGAFSKVSRIVSAGQTRQESSRIGLEYVNEHRNVLIHDAARPFLSTSIISGCIDELQNFEAVDVAIEAKDTLIEVNDERIIGHIPLRKSFCNGQTPQGFRASLIKEAHRKALQAGDTDNTDDCSLILKYTPVPIKVVQGSEFNMKITTPVDVSLADKLFQLRTTQIPEISLDHAQGKVIVVFGASSGIGKDIVDTLKEKAHIHGFSRSNGFNIVKIADIVKALETVYQKEGRIDAVIVTAGILVREEFAKRDIDAIEQEIQLNYLGSINAAHCAYKYLKESQGALVLFTSSSYTKGRALYATYSSVKAGLVNLTQALSEEWYSDGIRVNIMNPVRTLTPMRVKSFGQEPSHTLLPSIVVARKTIDVCLSNISGQIVDITLQKTPSL